MDLTPEEPRPTCWNKRRPDAALRRCIAAALVIAAALGIVWSAVPAFPQALKKIRVTVPVVATSMMPVYLAKGRGYFRDEGLDVEIITMNGGGPDIKALIAGDVDFTYTAVMPSCWPIKEACEQPS